MFLNVSNSAILSHLFHIQVYIRFYNILYKDIWKYMKFFRSKNIALAPLCTFKGEIFKSYN